jgi:hypothetical protein
MLSEIPPPSARSETSAPTLEEAKLAFAVAEARALRRLRWERVIAQTGLIAWGAALYLLLMAAAGLVFPALILYAPAIVGVAAIGGAVALAAVAARPLDRRDVRHRLDSCARLSDHALSAGDWDGRVDEPWRRTQLRQTAAGLVQIDWLHAWPLKWPRRLWLPVASVCLLVAVLWMWRDEAVFRFEQAARLAQQEKGDLKEESAALEKVFKDWEKSQQDQPDPDLQKLLEEIKPLREKLAEGELSEKELFVELNKVQERLAEMQKQLDEESVEPMAGDLAEALEGLDGAGALAAALRRKDFEAAQQEAAKAEKKFREGQSKMPSGSKADETSQRLQKVAAQLGQRGNRSMSGAAQQMSQAAQKGQGQQMGQGMGQLSDGLGREAGRQQQMQGLAHQASQMQAAKQGLGQKGQGQGQGQPQDGGMAEALAQLGKFSDRRGDKKGSGAGTGADPDRFGEATQLESAKLASGVSGQMGQEGPTDVSVEKTSQPQIENLTEGITQSQFSSYERLSRQAIEDESLPVAHRQMIKRYFESIKPGAVPASPK